MSFLPNSDHSYHSVQFCLEYVGECQVLDCGMTYKVLHKAAAEHDEARVQWKADMQANWVAKQCVMVDETSKDD